MADFDLGHKSVESGPATLTDFKDHPVLPKQLHSPGSRTSLTHCCFRSPAQPQKPSRDGRNELPTASNQFFSFLETFVSGVRPLKKSRRCCLPEFRTQAVTEACGTGLTHRAQRNWEGSMIDDFCRGWSNYCNPRRSCLPYLYLCFILRVQNNAASLIDFNMAAGGPTRLLRQECGFPRIDIAQDKFLLGIHTLGQPPPITYIERRASPANVCVCTYRIREICIRSTLAQHSLHSHETETLDTIKTMLRDCKMTPTSTKHRAATFFTSANLWRSTMVDKAMAKTKAYWAQALRKTITDKRQEHVCTPKWTGAWSRDRKSQVGRQALQSCGWHSWNLSRFASTKLNQTPSIPTILLDRQHSEASIQHTRSFLVSIHENANRPKTA